MVARPDSRATVPPNELNFSDQDWSFAGWFKRDGLDDEDILFHVGDGSGEGSAGELFLAGAADAEAVNFVVNGATTVLAPRVGTGEWHHAAITFQRTAPSIGDLKVYLDGVEVHSAVGVPLALPQNVPVVFGGHNVSTTRTDRWLNGKLDELGLWSARLNAAEIAKLTRMDHPALQRLHTKLSGDGFRGRRQ
jgi:hypothetical protein